MEKYDPVKMTFYLFGDTSRSGVGETLIFQPFAISSFVSFFSFNLKTGA